MQMGYFTGLEVSHEPGQWLVWAGVLLMGAGLFVAFYLVHMRVWIAADSRCARTSGVVGRRPANKNRDRFEQKFNELVDNIRTELEGASAIPPSVERTAGAHASRREISNAAETRRRTWRPP